MYAFLSLNHSLVSQLSPFPHHLFIHRDIELIEKKRSNKKPRLNLSGAFS
jgi:hypothetical protein